VFRTEKHNFLFDMTMDPVADLCIKDAVVS
jgi:hypothetical protein